MKKDCFQEDASVIKLGTAIEQLYNKWHQYHAPLSSCCGFVEKRIVIIIHNQGSLKLYKEA